MTKQDPEYVAEEEELMEREYIDQLVDEAMMDDYTFYQLLSDVE